MVRSTKRSGFTLVELLVVMAIISLLVALLLPSLARARDLAKSVKCLANLKSIGMAISLYGGDNDNVVIPAWIGDTSNTGTGIQGSQYYTNLLANGTYIPNTGFNDPPGSNTGTKVGDIRTGVWLCPSVPSFLAGSTGGSFGGGYGVNSINQSPNKPEASAMSPNTIASTSPLTLNHINKFTELPAPQDYWLLGDTKNTGALTLEVGTVNICKSPAIGQAYYPSGRHGTATAGLFGGMTNIIFTDFHAETIPYVQLVWTWPTYQKYNRSIRHMFYESGYR